VSERFLEICAKLHIFREVVSYSRVGEKFAKCGNV
jgi:hypothetical protein